ncbi:MAG: hypothetical protein A3C53_07120 [Omnitrophica WOR_2 bacterium RIFCSPHIGHO2_02_FULL_68_15]|nr:MAG: hypothetical protein A3C53_07120 [Omnitrophica WOR_2 bacterium RIFCSPHIGHO2_02_FULL_68_15]
MDRDDRWIVDHFDQLITQYGGRYIAVVGRQVVASGLSAKQVEDDARRRTGASLPSVIRIPSDRDVPAGV